MLVNFLLSVIVARHASFASLVLLSFASLVLLSFASLVLFKFSYILAADRI
jgi:hypothetical protein